MRRRRPSALVRFWPEPVAATPLMVPATLVPALLVGVPNREAAEPESAVTLELLPYMLETMDSTPPLWLTLTLLPPCTKVLLPLSLDWISAARSSALA